DLGANGAGDGQIDTVVINATNAADSITLTNNNGVITVSGLAETVTITNFEANDKLVINGLGGDDVVNASGLTGMLLTANGGDGVWTGGGGDDVLNGGRGQDILDGGPGNNVLIQAPVIAPANGSQAANVALLTQSMASTFVAAGGGQSGTPIGDPQSSQPPLL